MATAAERWEKRRVRRLVREASRLAEEVKSFAASVERSTGPYADEVRSLAVKSLDLVRLAAVVDGMRDVVEVTEEA